MIEPLTQRLIEVAYLEDSPYGDLTSELVIPKTKRAMANFIAKEPLVLAGMPYVTETFAFMTNEFDLEVFKNEGDTCSRGDVIAKVEGLATDLLRAERIALNLLQRLSGIATLTRAYIDRVKGLPVKIVDTRKTTPGMRLMEKYAVKIGGGSNHRFGLSDGILIKDNHIKAAGSITEAVRLARRSHHLLRIEVEVSEMDQVKEALDVGVDVIMLDNMDIDKMREAVHFINKRALVEASGGVNLDNVRAIAETGVDIISIGAITHSARAVDISMKVL